MYILITLHLCSAGNFWGVSSVFALAPVSSDVIFHYDAQDINGDDNIASGEPIDGSNIVHWQDAANSFTGSQIITSGQPIYQLNSINGILPGVTFDGVNDILEIQDNTDINLSQSFPQKSFALVIETGSDVSSTQTIYEQWTHLKWYGFQISGGHLYGWVWNSIDWWVGEQYKLIDYGPITVQQSYYILLIHDNTSVTGYLDELEISSLSGADTQNIHGVCQLDTGFGCSLYSTGGTIGIGATQNDTLKLDDQTSLLWYQRDYFAWDIWEIISWNIALDNSQVTDVFDYLSLRWDPDTTSPIISAYSPTQNKLLPIGNFSIDMQYSDEIDGSGIDLASADLTLQKWDGISAYGVDISGSVLSSSDIQTTQSIFDFTSVPYGKYRAAFEISDNAWNISSQEIIFYIDAIEMTVSTGSIDIGNVDHTGNSFSNEIEVTVRSLGAGHQVILETNTDLQYLDQTIEPSTIDWYGYETGPSYSNTLNDFSSSAIVGSQVYSVNTNGDKNTYIYRVKIGALVDMQQAAGDYSGSINIWLQLNYP